MAVRPYTGFDGNARGRRAGTEKLVQILVFLSGKAMWNNGTWNVRPVRGGTKPSVHGTGRAFDLSWRAMGTKGSGRYQDAEHIMRFLVENADVLKVEAVYDYHPLPFGRGWKCDRNKWKSYSEKTLGGYPGGDWIHVEIAPEFADDPGYYDRVIRELFTTPAPAPAPSIPAPSIPAPTPVETIDVPRFVRTMRRGSRGQTVETIQRRLADLGYSPGKADGWFGPRTEAEVKKFQAAHPVPPVDGIVGRLTWAALFAG